MSRKAWLPAVFFAFAAFAAARADDIRFSSDSMTGSMQKGRGRAVLTGNATVFSGSMEIKAARIELHGDDFRYVECFGSVVVKDGERKLDISTERLYYDRVAKLIRMSGPSIMEDARNGAVVKGDYIEYDDAKETAIIQVNVRILKDTIATRSEFARFDRRANTLELSGSPSVKRGDDEYRARFIRIALDTEEITLDGAVSGQVLEAAGTKDSPGDGR